MISLSIIIIILLLSSFSCDRKFSVPCYRYQPNNVRCETDTLVTLYKIVCYPFVNIISLDIQLHSKMALDMKTKGNHLFRGGEQDDTVTYGAEVSLSKIQTL